MKYIKQFGWIVVISLLGEILKWLLPLPIPASIYGLALMLIGLQSKVIPLGAVKEASAFLIEIMPLMFIPSAVGLLEAWGLLRPILLPAVFTILATTILVMAASGHVTQFVIRWDNRREGGQHHG